MGLRLSKEDLEALNEKFRTGPNIQHGKLMKEYAIVPDELLSNPKILFPYMVKNYS